MNEYTRANDFDRLVGKIQTEYAIKYGVGNSLLDIGCGVGEYTPLFLSRFKRVVGLDPSKEYLKEAKQNTQGISYLLGYGETFTTNERFDTISMNNILEHVDDPIALLQNCKKHLKYGGRIIVQVPNKNSVTRRLGVLMGLIPSIEHISEKERDFYGHQRAYDLDSLNRDCKRAELSIVTQGGILYKPLPNEVLLKIYQEMENKAEFLNALIDFGNEHESDCACIYTVCE
jgi:2-polyprenyl-3-methyl-5-hydroxy-6-metoxy-1,4-benzoquinol methylase